MKKGFTMIELLAVIVILAIIMLIAMPTFNNLIGQSREKTINSSIKNYIRAVDESIAALKDSSEDYNGIYIIQSDGKELVSTKTIVVSFEGKKVDEGYIVIRNGEVVRLINAKVDGYYVQFNNNEITVQTDKYETPNTCFNIESGKLKDYDNNNCATDVIIPSTVTIIDSNSFKEKNITSVVIPNSVTTIGTSAFEKNNITSVVIPNSVTTIGNYAFEENNITSVIIPNGVTTIGVSAFEKNQLKNISLPSSLTTVGTSAFAYNGLSEIIIGTSTSFVNASLNLSNVFSGMEFSSSYLPNSINKVTIYGSSSSSNIIDTNFQWSSNSTKSINWIN